MSINLSSFFYVKFLQNFKNESTILELSGNSYRTNFTPFLSIVSLTKFLKSNKPRFFKFSNSVSLL